MSGGAGTAWGKDPHPLLSLDEAWRVIAGQVSPLGVTRVPLGDSPGRVLAGPVATTDDDPPFDKAMMDGFAVRAADCDQAGAKLTVCGLLPAGETPDRGLEPGQAVRINTGAPTPPGADAVVKIEQTSISEDGSKVEIRAVVRPEQNIARQGGNRRKGDIVLSPPIRMGPGQLAAAATAGTPTLEVYEPAQVAIVATGNELAPISAARGPGQIFDSNGPMLAELMRQFRADPRRPRIARDTMDDLRAAFADGLTAPVLIAVGGMSMGTLDLVPAVLNELGVRWLFHGVAVKPGKPVAYGRGPDGQHVFGLPGNPISAFVCAWLFARMVIEGLQGFPARPPPLVPARLTTRLAAAKDPRPSLIPCRLTRDSEGHQTAEPCNWGGSGDAFALVTANALLLRREPTKPAEVGGTVDTISIE